MKKTPPQQLHIPVLLSQVVNALAPAKGESYLDLTAGYGGHSSEIISKTEASERAVLVDRDKNAIKSLSAKFAGLKPEIVHSDFLAAARKFLVDNRRFDMILIDLGVSSPQLDQGERGFSLMSDGPLDMRMDSSQERSAAEIVNCSSEKDLAKILVDYGEENPRRAQKIAHAIRLNRPIGSTLDLAKIVEYNIDLGFNEIANEELQKLHRCQGQYKIVGL